MSGEKDLRIAGVPEAFNDPFEDIDFVAHGVKTNATFVSYPGGSGAMVKAVVSGDVDAAFVLTDCLVAAMEHEEPLTLVSPLVTSPLRWAVVTASQQALDTAKARKLDDLAHGKWGVSRLGSGSHIMAQVLAAQRGWPALSFQVCGDFAGLRASVASGETVAFLWERFTTSPFVRSGHVDIITDIPTPWPPFCVAAHIQSARRYDIEKAVDAFLIAANAFANDTSSTPPRVAQRHGMTLEDAREWTKAVAYAQPGDRLLPQDDLQRIRQALHNAGVININDVEKQKERKELAHVPP